ncbi:uncharacterized protein LOC110992883 [Pieris rapae]|uniref:uncharacterized protein LOC110992883 n=1 Tax=Pieris rapae TaxID=64459 RepID=UPI001E27CD8B|nr:uncharacterized protein LOC110992883 [Pieris rapae]
MDHNIINTRLHENRVSSTYAEIYFDDEYCENKFIDIETEDKADLKRRKSIKQDDISDWISPSDLLIGIIELKPPFTSKINRGKTHEGILQIANSVLERERARFLKSLSKLVQENDSSWQHILKHEKETVVKRVRLIYDNIYKQKSKVMAEEISNFYEETLQDLEAHLRTEIQSVLTSTHANVISRLNNDIKQKLKIEKKKLENVLRKRLLSEVKKINTYYKYLLRNEVYRNETIICQALHERNNAIQAFLRQAEAEKLTSSMYVMSLERKKCIIKNLLLKNHHEAEIMEKIAKLKENQEIIDSYKQKDIPFFNINQEWEEKITKVLQLFLKFIGFSLKLLPEQSTFLLDLEKMMVLQLNEIQKSPEYAPSLLVDEKELMNLFKFQECDKEPTVCDKEPFILIGDLSDSEPPRYGSRETLTSDVELPFIRLQRQYMYARCHGYEKIKEFLKSQICICDKYPTPSPSLAEDNMSTVTVPLEEPNIPTKTESSEELLVCEDYRRLPDCPARKCNEVVRQDSFPFLPLYLDFTEENYNRVTAILGKSPERVASPDMIQPKEVVYRELPFSATKEPYHTVETQYSSQETISDKVIYPCTCAVSHSTVKESSSDINMALNKRKISLQQLMREQPNLLQLFTDESYDIQV